MLGIAGCVGLTCHYGYLGVKICTFVGVRSGHVVRVCDMMDVLSRDFSLRKKCVEASHRTLFAELS